MYPLRTHGNSMPCFSEATIRYERIETMGTRLLAKRRPGRKDIFRHETKREIMTKFLLVSGIFLAYLLFISAKYGIRQGFLVSALTWSFFVLCTPVADAGLLLDLPLRLITRIRMVFLEILVWIVAISLNLYAFFLYPEIYGKTKLLMLFGHIIESPLPFWSIILISAIGTFVSIRFGDELLDKAKHRQRSLYRSDQGRYRLILMAGIFVGTFILYDFLLKELGIEVPL